MTSRLPPPSGAAVLRRKPFRLVRCFSLISLVGLVVATTALLWAHRAQAEVFRGAHCAGPQGTLFCRPLPAAQVRGFLARHQSVPEAALSA